VLPPAVRINRYLAAAGLGTRREVEGLLRAGRVELRGVPCTSPVDLVGYGDVVLLDGREVGAAASGGAAFHRTRGAPLAFVHPPGLHGVEPETPTGGLELLLADDALARRLSDSRFPLRERYDRTERRVAFGPVELADLPEGAWRPLAPREIERLRRGARLPSRPR
jgi:hypothetical protein